MKPTEIPPSLLAETTRCERRGWLSAHDIIVAPAPGQQPEKKQHMPNLHGDWIYEVRLPSGARLDGWHRNERVAVEYKTEEPHMAHVLQGWAYALELEERGIEHAEMQLWYPASMQKTITGLAEGMGLQYRIAEENDIAVIWLNSPDLDFTETIYRAVKRLQELVSKTAPPGPKPRTAAACQRCPYHDFCHFI